MHLEDSEKVFRYLRASDYQRSEAGFVVHSTAFNDRNETPSIDIASKCPGGVPQNLLEDISAVVFLFVRQVRGLRIGSSANSEHYSLDVIPRPEPSNSAHGQIESAPPYTHKSHFKKVKEALAIIAGKQFQSSQVISDAPGMTHTLL